MPYELSDFHYLLLHFPIALFTSAFLFDSLNFFRNKKFPDLGFYNLSMGVAFSILTIISGFITDNDIGHMDNIWPIHLTHGAIQIIVSVLFLSLWLEVCQPRLCWVPWLWVCRSLLPLLEECLC